jgi:hypothetical protein
MRLLAIRGVIRRRILVNYRVDPQVIQAQLPDRFRPKLHKGQAIAGICLIRLESIRPRGLPRLVGVSSENAAHRIAVEWNDEDGTPREGVFILRRDTGSIWNRLAGGRLFPGEHHRANFDVRESTDGIDLVMASHDSQVVVRVKGRIVDELPSTSLFESLSEASRSFEPGSVGYSVTAEPDRLDGVELRTKGWRVAPLEVESVISTYFADRIRFPQGSVSFDCALIMRNLEHEWVRADDLYV